MLTSKTLEALRPTLPVRAVTFWAIILAISLAFNSSATEETLPPPGTRQMIERLSTLVKDSGPLLNPFVTSGRIAALRQQVEASRLPVERAEARIRLARELLTAGLNEESAREFGELRQEARRNSIRFARSDQSWIQMEEAIAWLRLGEQENCRLRHSPESCLVPIRGQGVHQAREGSERGRDLLLAHLRRFPRDWAGKWLLNIAVMTLGEYPAAVPERFLVPPDAFESEYPLPRFPEVAGTVGLDMNDLAGGTVVEDFDDDGMVDVLFSSWDWSGQLRLFVNQGDGKFVERTREAGLLGLVGGLNMVQGDYNNDGFADVFILRGAWMGEAGRHPNSLLKNNGDGTFADVTEQAGLLSFHPTQTAAWFDYDRDGWLDLFVGNESNARVSIGTRSGGGRAHVCEFFRNNGDGTFTEKAAEAGLAVSAFVKGAVAGDIDNDGWMDLYLSCLGEPNRLLLNSPGDAGTERRFVDIAESAGVTEPLNSFPTWFFDYDNNGWLDLFVAGYATNFNLDSMSELVADFLGQDATVERPRLFRNNGDNTFTDVASQLNLDKVLHAMGANFGDLDNDGWLDFYVGTGDPNLGNLIPNQMYRNAGAQRFQNVSSAGGFGHLQKGHAIAFADLNNDGFQEVVANQGGAYPGDNYQKALFANPRNTNHWISLRLQGSKSNRGAIGARIKVTVNTAGGPRQIYVTTGSGGSFGASSLRQEIGLGQALSIESVEIAWPSSSAPQVLTGLDLDRFYRVTEGKDRAVEFAHTRFNWPEANDHHHHAE